MVPCPITRVHTAVDWPENRPDGIMENERVCPPRSLIVDVELGRAAAALADIVAGAAVIVAGRTLLPELDRESRVLTGWQSEIGIQHAVCRARIDVSEESA